jgi:hypothetical protein
MPIIQIETPKVLLRSDIPNIVGSSAGTEVEVTMDADGKLRFYSVGGGGSGISQLTGDVTAGPGSGPQAATIANSAVTLAKIANASASSVLLGSGASGSGSAYSQITLGSGLTMTGTELSATGGGGGLPPNADYGDITVTDDGDTWTIDNDAVTLDKIANGVTKQTLLGVGEFGAGSSYSELSLGSELQIAGTVLSAPGIATNTADIATNAADIATNAADIATNATAIDLAPRKVSAENGNPVRTIISTSLTLAASGVIPANTLSTRSYRMTVFGDILQNSGSAKTVITRWTLGGANCLQSGTGFSNDTDRYGFRMVCEVTYRGASLQFMNAVFNAATAAGSAAGLGNYGGKFRDGYVYNPSVAQTDTGDLTLQLDMSLGSTTSSDIRIFHARLESFDAS